ncbi:MAG TPA: hypothetical protein VJ828_13155 [Lacipirellulaceae bacterium]|nr:hypothetical protein [Lacipirellulaceae bacterium]
MDAGTSPPTLAVLAATARDHANVDVGRRVDGRAHTSNQTHAAGKPTVDLHGQKPAHHRQRMRRQQRIQP